MIWTIPLRSNKPVLPTATNQPDGNPLNLLRRQTGQPLGAAAIGACGKTGTKGLSMARGAWRAKGGESSASCIGVRMAAHGRRAASGAAMTKTTTSNSYTASRSCERLDWRPWS
jgi:hypothetical protein